MNYKDHVRFVRHAETNPDLQAEFSIGDVLILAKPPELGDCGLWTAERVSDGFIDAVFEEEVEAITDGR